jgi:hypothetical protein
VGIGALAFFVLDEPFHRYSSKIKAGYLLVGMVVDSNADVAEVWRRGCNHAMR